MPPTLVIVDDHVSFRTLTASILGQEGFEVTGVAGDGESALELIAELNPEAVLLDVQLPGIDGFEVARRLAELRSPPKVVLTSSREAADFGHQLAEAAIRGFIPKGELSGSAVAALLEP